MIFRILDFQKINKQSVHEIRGYSYNITDYWQYYITGLETLVNDKDFFIINRYQNERSEVLAYDLFDDENISDVLVLTNNDNYLFDAPPDFDLGQDIINNRMTYLRKLNKKDFTPDEEKYWQDKMYKQVDNLREIQSQIVIPTRSSLQKVIRHFREYIRSREVK